MKDDNRLPECEVVKPYDLFALCYDRMMRHVDYPAWAAFVAEEAAELGVESGRVVDLACGTGVVLDLLSGFGYVGEGIDLSEAMLERAAKRFSGKGEFTFSRQDMRSFVVRERADLLVCLHDSFNYLMDRSDMVRTLRRIAAALRTGGVAVFDVSTRYNIVNNFAGRVFSDECSDYAYIWKNSFNRFTAVADVSIEFMVEGAGFGSERHLQKIHSRRSIKQAVAAVPELRLVAEYGGMERTPVRRNAVGISYVLQKR